MGKKICLVAGSAPTYRKEIFVRMGEELGCDYILGAGATKQMALKCLPNKVMETKTIRLKWLHAYRQPGVVRMTKDYDTLIVNMGLFSITEWSLLMLSKVRKQKIFIWAHGWYGKETRVQRMVKRFYFSLADGIFVYGDRARKLMTEAGICADKIFPIHNSLAYSVQKPLRDSLSPSDIYQRHFGNDHKNIVFIGRLTAVKRLDLLLDAVGQLKREGEAYNVVFIGDGVEKERMKAQAKEAGISEQVWFYGECFDERTNAEMIYNADLCVSPGNIGLTAIHVLMFGCPAITNDDFNHQMPEFEAIENGKTGLFFKAGDSHSLAQSISRWFRDHSANREAVRQQCYDVIDRGWNPDYQIKIIKDAISMQTNENYRITPPPDANS